MKFKTACQGRQAGESAVKCPFPGPNRIAGVDLKPRPL